MVSSILKQAAEILRKRKESRRWQKAALCLAAVAGAGTIVALMSTGQALTREDMILKCELEVHEHTDECKDAQGELACGYADFVIHEHNDDCYDSEGKLVCELPEIELHEHEDSCYEEQEVLVCEEVKKAEAEKETGEPVEKQEPSSDDTQSAGGDGGSSAGGVLSCGKEEHSHSEDGAEEVLTCGESEHSHGDGCYDENSDLTCSEDEHSHGDGCYETQDVSCDKEEHSHSDECYSSVEGGGDASVEVEAVSAGGEDAGADSAVDGGVDDGATEADYAEMGMTEVVNEGTEVEAEAADAAAAAEGDGAVDASGTEDNIEDITDETVGADGHVHTEECYAIEPVLICEEEELELHVHVEEPLEEGGCYDISAFDEETGDFIEGSFPACGMLQLEEHVHTEKCFKSAGIKHVHDKSCYDENGNLICDFADMHEHDKNCYDEDGNLICGYDDAEDHEHDVNCYDEDGNLMCGYEGVKEHEHDANCYDKDGNLICCYEGVKEHEHDANCYDVRGNLICGYEGVNDHVHSETCYDENGNLICGYEVLEAYEFSQIFECEDYIVIVKYNQDAEIPEDAKLLVKQITPDSDEEHYGNREAEYREMMEDENASMRALLDIGFYREDGEEIEPKTPVTVVVQFLDEDGLAEGKPITIVHFAEGGTEKLDGSKAKNNSTTFKMESLSEIAIGYGSEGFEIKEDGTVYISDSFEYEDDAFKITFYVEGEAVPVDGSGFKTDADDGTGSKENTEETDDGEDAAAEDGNELDEEDVISEDESESEDKDVSSEEEQDQERAADETDDKKEDVVQNEETSEDTATLNETVDEDVEDTGSSETENGKKDNDNEMSPSGDEENEGADEEVSPDEEEKARKKNDLENNTEDHKLEFTVEHLEQGAEEYEALSVYAEELDELDELLRMQVLSFKMTLDEIELDLSGCEVTAEVAAANRLQDHIEESLPEAVSYLASNDVVVIDPDKTETEEVETDQADEETEEEEAVPEEEQETVTENNNQRRKSRAAFSAANNELEEEADLGDSEIRVYGDEETNPEEEEIEIEDETEIMVAVAELSDEQEVNEVESMVLSEKSMHKTMSFSLNKNTFALRSTMPGVANPTFRVEYYANLKKVVKSGGSGTELKVINTSNGSNYGENKGNGELPKNGGGLKDSPNTKSLQSIYLNGNGVVQTEVKPTRVYKTKRYEYKEAPSLMYFDCLVENAGYEVVEVWVKYETDPSIGGEGFKPSGINPDKDGWYKYTYNVANPKLHFTNRRLTAEQEKNYVYINNGATIRLVYNPTENKQNVFDAKFYDYNITDGKTGNVWNTSQTGINSAGNYEGSGAKYAFGNANCGTGLKDQKMGSNFINRYNRTSTGGIDSYEGCAFGLVSGVNGEDVLFKSGINGLKIFGSSALIGKDIYPDGSLNFVRSGDTFTLTSANSTVGTVSNLHKFTRWTEADNGGTPHTIWSNNFWPVDNANALDPKFGTKGSPVKHNSTENGGEFPVSDDGIAHNSFFGMYYTISFNLDKDYTGPLEYLFFGDDDMWVFLDGELICDLGGVHSSVGEYVNLWDWLEETDKGKEHTLKFFYTERGASGSSCWMQFTLPSVTSVPLEQNTGTLEISKEVSYEDSDAELLTDEEFAFKIKLTNSSSKELMDDYCYTKYDKNGREIGGDLILWSGSDFTLKKGERIVVKYLPIGTKYTITELDSNGSENYEPQYAIEKKTGDKIETVTKEKAGKEAKGQISQEGIVYKVKFNNVRIIYELPETGGFGSIPYTMAGILCLLVVTGFVYKRKSEKGAA